MGFAVASALLGAAFLAVLARPLSVFDAFVRLRLWLAGVRSRCERTAGIDLHWLERAGSAPPVLLLHGLGADPERFFPILPGLLPGRRLLAPSLPAHGRSGAPAEPFGVEEVGAWLDAWLSRRVGSEQLDLIGFSLGGWVALQLVLLRPQRVRRLVLVSSAGVRFEPPPRQWLAPRGVDDVGALIEALTARRLRLPRFVLRDLMRRARPQRRFLVDSLFRGEGLLDGRLGEIQAPTLVLWGREDRIVPPEVGRRLASAIPGARSQEFAGCGHLPYWERRAEFVAAVEGFLG
ncbi:MAG: alpha/beta fold hydrolase [Acidobacteriota bacterium]